MDYPIPIPEPLPEPEPETPCVIQINLLAEHTFGLDFFLLLMGAGIGYFMIGHCGGLWCLRNREQQPTPTQVILARTISNQNQL